VTRFHYVNGLLDTRRATMTGMTRDGTFLIEGGTLGRGVRNLRFTESVLAALGRVGGIGRQLHRVPTRWSSGGTLSVPALLVREFHFTGKSR
jgi:predicted Zn-dependent protease